ncbi:hypothetical protein [Archangium primigenium]|uniref:hypothetical protein n=1 Tax=[Archangium] primigenium TaxID=2792470 RepID=UPI001956233B|nr:hypothetical protein [Archangium primigenium]MBM7119169.1 hypothetical protein [Archangium primigenium]
MPVPQNVSTAYGFRVQAPGYVTPADARAWFEDLQRQVSALEGRPFGLLLDARTQRANPPDTQALVREAMAWSRAHGLERAAVVLDSTVALIPLLRAAKSSGTDVYERYLDAEKDADWEARAEDWIVRGTDPDLLPPPFPRNR